MGGDRLVLVALVVEHGKGDDEEDENGIGDVDGEPECLHREGEITGTIVNGMPARLPVGDVGRQHQDGDGGDREAKNHHQFRKVSLVHIVRMLVVHQQVDAHQQDQNRHHHRHDHQCQIEIPHRSPPFFFPSARSGSGSDRIDLCYSLSCFRSSTFPFEFVLVSFEEKGGAREMRLDLESTQNSLSMPSFFRFLGLSRFLSFDAFPSDFFASFAQPWFLEERRERRRGEGVSYKGKKSIKPPGWQLVGFD